MSEGSEAGSIGLNPISESMATRPLTPRRHHRGERFEDSKQPRPSTVSMSGRFTRVPTPLSDLDSGWKALTLNACVGLGHANERLTSMMQKQVEDLRLQEERDRLEWVMAKRERAARGSQGGSPRARGSPRGSPRARSPGGGSSRALTPGGSPKAPREPVAEVCIYIQSVNKPCDTPNGRLTCLEGGEARGLSNERTCCS
eukprot:176094-Pyramimonas_sp.AAC.1